MIRCAQHREGRGAAASDLPADALLMVTQYSAINKRGSAPCTTAGGLTLEISKCKT
jgi:hypothetical protein